MRAAASGSSLLSSACRAGQPSFAARQGRHEFDGQLPDLSAHGIKREIARLHDQREQISAVDPATLQPRERFDRAYLLAVLDRDLFWIEKTQFPFKNPGWYLEKIDPEVYLSRNYAPLDVRMKAYIKYARAIPRMAYSIKENLKAPLPKTYVELGIAEFGGLAAGLHFDGTECVGVGAELELSGRGLGDVESVEQNQGLVGFRACDVHLAKGIRRRAGDQRQRVAVVVRSGIWNVDQFSSRKLFLGGNLRRVDS